MSVRRFFPHVRSAAGPGSAAQSRRRGRVSRLPYVVTPFLVIAGPLLLAGPASAAVLQPPRADLVLTKTDAPDPAPAQGTLTYTLAVTNLGPDTATWVTVADALPASVTLLSVTPSQGTCTRGPTTTCVLGTLAAGTAATVSLVVEISATSPPSIVNAAAVAGAEIDPNPANNSASAITTVTTNPGCTITGTPGNDNLAGSSGNDVICGLGGNDSISGGGGVDVLYGGAGNDNLSGGSDTDVLYGGAGDDALSGGSGTDILVGGSGADTLSGGSDDDVLDSVDGVSGNDTNSGGSGNNTCLTDPGDLTVC